MNKLLIVFSILLSNPATAKDAPFEDLLTDSASGRTTVEFGINNNLELCFAQFQEGKDPESPLSFSNFLLCSQDKVSKLRGAEINQRIQTLIGDLGFLVDATFLKSIVSNDPGKNSKRFVVTDFESFLDRVERDRNCTEGVHAFLKSMNKISASRDDITPRQLRERVSTEKANLLKQCEGLR